jgi:hypothetical protein
MRPLGQFSIPQVPQIFGERDLRELAVGAGRIRLFLTHVPRLHNRVDWMLGMSRVGRQGCCPAIFVRSASAETTS